MKRDRVIQAINHKQTDIVPFNVELTKNEMKKACKYLDIKEEKFFDWAGNHIEKYTCGTPDVEIRNGYFEDEFGVVWNRTVDKDIGVVERLTFENPDIDTYQLPDIDFERLNQDLKIYTNSSTDTFKFAKINFTLFERAWSLRGFENIFMDFLLNPDFVHDLLNKITQRNLKIIETALQYDIDGIYLGDDYGQQTGMLMSPQIWREFIKPNLQKMFSMTKAAGKYTCLHSCGNIMLILEDLAEIGLDIYQTVQPEIYDLEVLKDKLGNKLTFFGAISTQRELPAEKPQRIKEIVKETITILGKNGGYIAAPTHKVPEDVPVENLIAMVEEFKEQ